MLLCLKHWIYWERRVPLGSLFHSIPNRLEFFDGFGREPYEFGFSFPKSLQIFHNPYQIQAVGTQVCGHFCIYILYHRAHNYALNSICKRFSILPFVGSASIVSSFIRNAHERINKKWMITCERHEGIEAFYRADNLRKRVIYAYVKGLFRSYTEKSRL